MSRSKTPKLIELTDGEVQMLEELKADGYAFPADTDVGVFRRTLRDAYVKHFPKRPIPKRRQALKEVPQ